MRCVSHICGLIHQEYCDFCEPLKKGLMKMFDNYGGKEEEKVGQILTWANSQKTLQRVKKMATLKIAYRLQNTLYSSCLRILMANEGSKIFKVSLLKYHSCMVVQPFLLFHEPADIFFVNPSHVRPATRFEKRE